MFKSEFLLIGHDLVIRRDSLSHLYPQTTTISPTCLSLPLVETQEFFSVRQTRKNVDPNLRSSDPAGGTGNVPSSPQRVLATNGSPSDAIRNTLIPIAIENIGNTEDRAEGREIAKECIGAMGFPNVECNHPGTACSINHERPCEKKYKAPEPEEAFRRIMGPVTGNGNLAVQGHPLQPAPETPVRVVKGGKRPREESGSEGSPGSDHNSAKPLQKSRKLNRGGSSGIPYSDATTIPGRLSPVKNDADDLAELDDDPDVEGSIFSPRTRRIKDMEGRAKLEEEENSVEGRLKKAAEDEDEQQVLLLLEPGGPA
ncbi:hypothetical protein EST38_g2090 [Candolleomyces aberdarensis]|uniref:Uncharacterized protein n=1 Tax=Candolleomyces aberdarensis TaxID=2316362 RepID=A0A4Q2DWX7_9AGAR|nr:hypothetical protein EST38_g2090 [Candolleomyces aberdarensis]